MADSRLLRRLARCARLSILLLLLLLLVRLRFFLLFWLLRLGGYFAACLFRALVVLDLRHRLQGLVVAHHILRRSTRLLRGRLRPARSRHQHYFLERAWISWRPKQHVVVVRSIQQLRQYIPRRAWPEPSDHSFTRNGGHLDSGACLLFHCGEDVTHGGVH